MRLQEMLVFFVTFLVLVIPVLHIRALLETLEDLGGKISRSNFYSLTAKVFCVPITSVKGFDSFCDQGWVLFFIDSAIFIACL